MKSPDPYLIALLTLVSILLFYNGLQGGFVYDDRVYVENNRQVTGEAPIFSESTPNNRTELGLYRPVFTLTLRLNHIMGGNQHNFAIYHWTNLVIHILNVGILYFLVLMLSNLRIAALFSALFFAIHPTHAEAVTWIVGRSELLAFLFCLLGAMAHFKAKGRLWVMLLEGLCFVLAALSKENALAFPLVIWILDRTCGQPIKKPWIQDSLARFWIYPILILGILMIRFQVLGRLSPDIATAPFRDTPFLGRAEAGLACLAEYIRLTIYPYPLKIFYHITELSSLNPMRLLILGAFAGLVFAAFKKNKLIFGWLLWIPASLLTVLNLVPIGAVFAERFFYLPSAGGCVAGGLALAAMIRSKKSVQLTIWIPTTVVICFGVLLVLRNPVFKDDFSLWKDAMKKGKEFAYTHYNLGECYAEAGIWEYESVDKQGAVAELQESLRIRPDHPYSNNAHYRLAQYYITHKYNALLRTCGESTPKSVANELIGYLKSAAAHLITYKNRPRHADSKLWMSALEYARIPTYWGGQSAVTVNQARDALKTALSLGAPQDQVRKVLNQLNDLTK